MSLPLKERLVYIFRFPCLFLIFLYQDIYCWFKRKKTDPSIRLDGKVILVTGANRGIGKQIASDLYKRGAKVILACRNTEAALKACSEISNGRSDDRLVPLKLDLKSFTSINDACSHLYSTLDSLDILINNAGMFGAKDKTITADGFEETCQVNFLAPCLLTYNLIPLLSKSTFGARVIMISSEFNLIPFSFNTDLFVPSSPDYDAILNYAMTKFALNGFVLKMASLLKDTNITINSVHPGCVKTDIVGKGSSWTTRFSNRFQQAFRGVSLETGAIGPVYLAVEPSMHKVSGHYFVSNIEFSPNKRLLQESVQNCIWNFMEPCLLSYKIDCNSNKETTDFPIPNQSSNCHLTKNTKHSLDINIH
ncbi:uncharacterized protein LOC107362111 [Tetranychus urticae]|uniref:Uncharacterized protein n=1 Tax=Tetranychus urticae TaxID=32264 RepID=T1K9S1_TETUR|nr:uncharacterized protein LOC107362111 [Tetranychus urticae]XP_015784604.1 uncharacterized protein LOC107362111 [Tetranychus urticae]